MSLKLRVIICVCILSVLVSLALLSNKTSKIVHNPEYTAFTDGVATTDGVFFCENWDNNGWIYFLDYNGNVKNIICSAQVYENYVSDVCIANGKAYGLFFNFRDEDGLYGFVYNIVEMDEKLKPLRQIDDIRLDGDENVTGFSADAENFYITTVAADTAYVYKIPADDMKDVKFTPVIDGNRAEKKLSELSYPDCILFRKLDGRGVIVDARYEEGLLSIRSDTDVPKGVFLPDARVREAVNKIHFGIPQNMKLYGDYIVYWAAGIIIWFILLFLLIRVLTNRNRVIYMALAWEFTLLILIAGAFIFIKNEYKEAALNESSRFAVLSLQGDLDVLGNLDNVDFEDKNFYSSEMYYNIYNNLTHFISRDGNYYIFDDAFLVNLKTDKVVVDGNGVNGDSVGRYYGSAGEEITAFLRENSKGYSSKDLTINGVHRLLVGVTEDDNYRHNYALIGVLSGDDPFMGFWGDSLKVFFFFLVVFLEASAFILLILYLQHADLKRFEREIREVALGRTKVNTPKTSAADMKSLWDSLSEIGKRIESVNYERFRIYEAYYRFAPKDIETIMDKDSIFDVNNGDMTDVEGTLMLVCTEKHNYDEGRIKALRNVVSYMDNYVGDREGILVSHNSALSLMEFLFLEGSSSTVSKAVQFLHRNDTDKESDPVSIFMYQTSFTYGVVGINDKSLTYLTSDFANEVEAYAEWFEKLKVPLVITEWIYKKENIEPVRYIGYITLLDNREKLHLYEVLDACTARDRQLKLSLKERFEETLQLFYNRDFYLARNRFTEILKECPNDEITRWYLFESERYLNEGIPDKEFGELRI